MSCQWLCALHSTAQHSISLNWLCDPPEQMEEFPGISLDSLSREDAVTWLAFIRVWRLSLTLPADINQRIS